MSRSKKDQWWELEQMRKPIKHVYKTGFMYQADAQREASILSAGNWYYRYTIELRDGEYVILCERVH